MTNKESSAAQCDGSSSGKESGDGSTPSQERNPELVFDSPGTASAAGPNWMDEARQIAAQCWCDEETSHIPMEPVLCEAVARRIASWMDTGAQHASNEEYWYNRTLNAERELAAEKEKHADAARFAVGMDHANAGLYAELEDLQEQLVATKKDAERLQARLDALMLDHCPDEMSEEQIQTWTAAQRPVTEKQTAAIDAAQEGGKMNQCLCLKRAAKVCRYEAGLRDYAAGCNALLDAASSIESIPCDCLSARVARLERHADAMADAIKGIDFFSAHVAVADYEKWKDGK